MDEHPVIIFSAPVARRLISDQVRLPPTHVGVRRVRPSSKIVKDAFFNTDYSNQVGESTDASLVQNSNIVFKVTDENGVERRMNTQEKKELKNRLKRAKIEEKKRIREERRQQQQEPKIPAINTQSLEQSLQLSGGEEVEKKEQQMEKSNDDHQSDSNNDDSSERGISPIIDAATTQKRQYHELEVSRENLDEELADLRGERSGVAPVMLSGPMARQALRTGVLISTKKTASEEIFKKDDSCIVDDALSKSWAEAIKQHMLPAEEARSREDMRPMAYELVPEVWTRLRPESLYQNNTHNSNQSAETPPKKETLLQIENSSTITNESDFDDSIKIDGRQEWSFVSVRRPQHRMDSDLCIVMDQIYQFTNLHVSCGAKFGCDFLLYDGSRDERHAFAGVRLYSCRGKDQQFPLPSAFDLAGYVRGLNTAGKLALIATVVRNEGDGDSTVKLAFVDLALEKLLTAPTHQKKSKRRKQTSRKEIGTNLAKR
uniref:Uncharacterized protein n=1 Tax=Attheya septentrionalis TaxID=420275 RepID=A0A7S2XQ68_9STRA|mmetsp:Transcript_26811/g.48703  ORF Transcript_26811/g.48703 Transcript_26811/m.48703 type:complete len:487 (+) Transcript_26811:223-1683(+)